MGLDLAVCQVAGLEHLGHPVCRELQGTPAATPAQVGGVQVGHCGVGARCAAEHHLGRQGFLFSNLRRRTLPVLGGLGHAPKMRWVPVLEGVTEHP